MSQTTFQLEDVLSWQTDDYQAKWQDILPNLITHLETTEEKFTDVLGVIYTHILPAVHFQRFDELVFSKTAPKISGYIDHIFRELAETASAALDNSTQHLTSLLQVLLDVVSCVEIGITAVLDTGEVVQMRDVHSVSVLSVHMISTTYAHCKDSGSIYGSMLGFVSDVLSMLFKKVHSLQMSFIRLIDKVSLSLESSEADQKDMCSVIKGLDEISKIASSLDVKIVVVMWKTISRLVCQHKSSLSGHLEVNSLISSLCDEITSSYKYSCEIVCRQPQTADTASTEERAFLKNIKVVGFQCKVLDRLLSEFKSQLNQCIRRLYQTLLTVHTHRLQQHDPHSMSRNLMDETGKQLNITAHSILTHLIDSSKFIWCITASTQNFEDEEMHLVRSVLLSYVVDNLHSYPASVQNEWLSEESDTHRYNIIKALFTSLDLNMAKLHLPLYLPSASNESKTSHRAISLYEHLCMKLCVLSAQIPPAHLHILESCLLENVIGRDLQRALLAIDVWSFICRLGSAQLCVDHCKFVATLLCQVPHVATPSRSHVVILFKRLLKCLKPPQQLQFLRRFPPEKLEFLALWAEISLGVFTANIRQKLVDCLLSVSHDVLKQWLQTKERTPASTATLVCALNCLTRVYECHIMNRKEEENLLMDIHRLWHVLSVANLQRFTCLCHVVCSLLALCTELQSVLSNKLLLQIVNQISAYISSDAEQCVKLAAMSFLRHLCTKTFPPSVEQPAILQGLANLFNQLLTESNCVLRQCSLQAFAEFAESTAHESVIPAAMEGNDSAREVAIEYFNQFSKMSETGSAKVETEDMLASVDYCAQRNATISDYLLEPISSFYVPLQWPNNTDIETTPGCSEHTLATLRQAIQQIAELHKTNALTTSMKLQLTKLHAQLGCILADDRPNT